MFDEVSPRYDLINDVLSAGNSRLWRVALTKALQPRKGMRILDLAAGTGTASAAIAKHGAHVTAADFSEGMIAEGRIRQAGNELIDFVWADATQLPFEDDSFDAATISFGLRNVEGPERALAEMFRVVKPGGRVVICEFSRPTSALMRGPYVAYSRVVLPRIAGLINKSAAEAYRYLNESIEAWPAQDRLAAMLREAGFERVAYRNLTGGIVALHRGFVPREPVEIPAAPAAPVDSAAKPKAAAKPKTPARSKAAASTRAAAKSGTASKTTPAAPKPSSAEPAPKRTEAPSEEEA